MSHLLTCLAVMSSVITVTGTRDCPVGHVTGSPVLAGRGITRAVLAVVSRKARMTVALGFALAGDAAGRRVLAQGKFAGGHLTVITGKVAHACALGCSAARVTGAAMTADHGQTGVWGGGRGSRRGSRGDFCWREKKSQTVFSVAHSARKSRCDVIVVWTCIHVW